MMKTIVVAVAILSACFMQEVSGAFLNATPKEKKEAVTQDADAKAHLVEDKNVEQKQHLTLDTKVEEEAKAEKQEEIQDIQHIRKFLEEEKEGRHLEQKKAEKKEGKKHAKTEKKEETQHLKKKVKADEKVDEEDDAAADLAALDTRYASVAKLAATAEELDTDAAKDGALDAAKKAGEQAVKNLRVAMQDLQADEDDINKEANAEEARDNEGDEADEEDNEADEDNQDNEKDEILEKGGGGPGRKATGLLNGAKEAVGALEALSFPPLPPPLLVGTTIVG